MDEAKPPAGNKGPLMLDSIEPIVNQKSPPDSPQNLKSNTMEAQSLPLDLKKPRNAPQLIGLTSLNYKPSELEHTTTERSPEKNLLTSKQMESFFKDKPKSKRVSALRKHTARMSSSQDLLEVKIHLPEPMLLEQINLAVGQSGKNQSDFSASFMLVAVENAAGEPLEVKSSFSETVTRTGSIEYNLVACTRSVNLIFAKSEQAIELEDVELKVSSQVQDLQLEDKVLDMLQRGEGVGQLMKESDNDDDIRILDSLPQTISSQKRLFPPAEQDPLFARLLQSIQVIGFDLTTIPAITNLTYFMNQQLFLQGRDRQLQASQLDFMIGQLLVTTKRATQAAETYRKMQARILKKSKADATSPAAKSALVECAVLELLVADSLSVEHQMSEKMQSVLRMAQFTMGQLPKRYDQRFSSQPRVNETDCFTSMMQVLPECLRFTLLCLSHRYEIVRISALKLLKHILETQGCSLDFGLVFILKGMLCTYPVVSSKKKAGEPNLKRPLFEIEKLIDREMQVTEYLFQARVPDEFLFGGESPNVQATPCTRDDPASGFRRALTNTYQNVLDTFISVLSSVSSHILHSIFYEVIEPTMLTEATALEVRIFTCKIAEKIITICQGDLLMSPPLMDCLLTQVSESKSLQPESAEANSQAQIKNLWHSIRQKVFPNYSTRGFRGLVDWLVSRLTDIRREDSEQLEEQIRQMSEIISIVAMGRQKGEEDANQLIRLPTCERFGGGASSELYLVLTPLIFWLEFSIDKRDRLSLFQQIYQTIKDVLGGLPAGQCDLDIPSMMIPSLQRTNEFLAGNSPPLPMLKFLDIVLGDMQRFYSVKGQRPAPPQDMQYFFLEMLSNLATYLSYSLYEEVFLVFDKLLSLCADLITEHALKKCIVALVDKYTMKSKNHKATLTNFMKCLLDVNVCKKAQSPKQPRIDLDGGAGLSDGGADLSIIRGNYFEVMADFCFFNNDEDGGAAEFRQLDFRSPQDLRDLFVDKLQFFIDSIALMNDSHISLFTNLITHPNFKQVLLNLLANGDTNVRLKSHEIMEALTAYFVQFCPSKTVYEFASGTEGRGQGQNEMMDAEFISHERLYISQIVICIAKVSLEKQQDCYLQFNALILLDFLFQNLLPVPSFQNEQLKSKRAKQEAAAAEGNRETPIEEYAMDVEVLSISESTPELDVLDPSYLRMRMRLVYSLWPHVLSALNSPWSNIRSICYGLICSMLKIDINDYPKDTSHLSFDSKVSSEPALRESPNQQTLKELILPMLYSLLSSKESESKAGGLNILGSFCGLSYDFTNESIHKNIAFFQRNSKFVSLPIWQLVYQLQDDWDITIKEASVVLVQLCAPRNAILYFQTQKEKTERARLKHLQLMPKASEIYQGGKLQSSVKDASVKTVQALRACSLFPSDQDVRSVLDQSINEKDHSLVPFADFMMDRKITFTPELPSLSMIDANNQALAEHVHSFNPTYEDKRLTRAHQPMSRRRQIEIELNMNRGKKGAQDDDMDPNFFVDAYSDDQIQEIISIFRNDFKPPKNLWIEKQPNTIGGAGSSASQMQQSAPAASPDFFQDIYSDAIEQFNQHQMMMQQKQQDELQQQVSSGSSLNTSLSSFASEDGNSVASLPAEGSQRKEGEHNSSGSNTPSPTPPERKDTSSGSAKMSPEPPQIETCRQFVVPIGPVGPTSPVLVSQMAKDSLDTSKRGGASRRQMAQLQMEHLNFNAIAIPKADQPKKTKEPKPLVTSMQNQIQTPSKTIPELTENDYFKESDQHIAHLKNHTQRVEPKKEKFQTAIGSNSTPDFSMILQGQKSPKVRPQVEHNTSAGQPGSDEQRISRKMAQTYLSGLSQGYIQNMDNLKLLNNCISSHNKDAAQLKSKIQDVTVSNKISARNNPLLDTQIASMGAPSLTNVNLKGHKKSTLSSSPQAKQPRKGSAKFKSVKDIKKQSADGHSKLNMTQQPSNCLADLNYFIKTIEKDLSEKLKNRQELSSMPNTPSSLIKKVGDQMKALGVDPKLWKQVEAHELRKTQRLPPQVKLLALNQIVKDDQSTCTPSNQGLQGSKTNKTSSTNRKGHRSSDSDGNFGSELSKSARHDKKGGYNITLTTEGGEKYIRHQQTRHEIATTRELEKPSTARGVSSHSGGARSKESQMLLSEKVKQHPVTTKAKDVSGFQFKKGSTSKSQQKGFSALATKSLLSQQFKRDQQSGGLIQSQNVKLNSSVGAIGDKGSKRSKAAISKEKGFGAGITKGFIFELMNNNNGGIAEPATARQPLTQRNLEQGDRQTLSPESASLTGKPPLRKKAAHQQKGGVVAKPPGLVLQQPSYY